MKKKLAPLGVRSSEFITYADTDLSGGHREQQAFEDIAAVSGGFWIGDCTFASGVGHRLAIEVAWDFTMLVAWHR